MRLFWIELLVVVILGGLVGTLLVRDAGYILVSYDQYVMETSLWVGVFLLVLAYFVLRGLIYLFRQAVQGPGGLLRWRSARRLRAARSQTVRGLLVMAEGRWADAQKLLVAGAQQVETPLVNYLNAAKTAHELGTYSQRDDYLRLAADTTPGSRFAVSLHQAEFFMAQGKLDTAAEILVELHKRVPKHNTVLRMLSRCYHEQQNWTALRALMPVVLRTRAMERDEYNTLALDCARARVEELDPIKDTWKELSKEHKRDVGLIRHWVDLLVAQDRVDDADQVLRLSLSEDWQNELVDAFSLLEGGDVKNRLEVVKKWAGKRGDDAAVNLAMGRLLLLDGDLEGAETALQKSVAKQDDPAVNIALGKLFDRKGDAQRSTEHLLKAIG